MTIIQRIEDIGFENILRAYGFHSELISRHYSADTRIKVLDEYIAASERLKGQDGKRRELIDNINLILMQDLLQVMDEAQDEFEQSVAAGGIDWDLFPIALLLYYGSMLAIARHHSSRRYDEEMLKAFRRSFEVDWLYFRRWRRYEEARLTTLEQWKSRGKLYGGNARGTVFDSVEDAMVASEAAHNLVARFVCRGDKNSCIPCKTSEGYYLLTEGPMPGRVCKGKSRCRCRRIVEHNPTMFAKLSKEPVSVFEREW